MKRLAKPFAFPAVCFPSTAKGSGTGGGRWAAAAIGRETSRCRLGVGVVGNKFENIFGVWRTEGLFLLIHFDLG